MRFVITGIGIHDSLGSDPSECFNNIITNNQNLTSTSNIDSLKNKNIKTKFCFLEKQIVPDLTKYGYTEKELRRLTNNSKIALGVVEHAIKDANINIHGKEVPVVFSSSTRNIALDYLDYINNTFGRLNPFIALNYSSDFISNCIQTRYNLTGQSLTLSAACSTGFYSIDYALKIMSENNLQCTIVGTSSNGCNYLDITWFENLGALSKKEISRPFDKNRDGFMIANGHACLIIETLEHAEKRNAKIYAEIIGLGFQNDGNNLTAPDKEMKSSRIALERCLKNFNGQIDYINAHATSTPVGDDIEASLMEKYFPGVSISSNKGHIGHCIHSSNIVELIYTIMAMKHSLIPHTMNLNDPLDANLDFVMHKPKEKQIRYALKNSFGFGGRNGFILLKNCML
jgi:3-oxoacyl-[acyl-carrier-protein] synthase II